MTHSGTATPTRTDNLLCVELADLARVFQGRPAYLFTQEQAKKFDIFYAEETEKVLYDVVESLFISAGDSGLVEGSRISRALVHAMKRMEGGKHHLNPADRLRIQISNWICGLACHQKSL